MFESFGLIHTRSYPTMVEVVRYLECDVSGEVADVSTVAVFTHFEHKDPAVAARAYLDTLTDEASSAVADVVAMYQGADHA